MKVHLESMFLEVPDIEKLRDSQGKTEQQFEDKTIFIIADMSSVQSFTKKASEILEYEKNSAQRPQGRKMERALFV